MLKGIGSKERHVTRSNYYVPSDLDVNLSCKSAAQLFSHGFRVAAIEAYKVALASCTSDNLDRAFVLRRLASAMIHSGDPSEEKASEVQAKATEVLAYLQESIKIHEKIHSYDTENRIGCVEYQRCLNSLCSIAVNFRDGPLIKKSALKLLDLAQKTSNYRFAFDAFDYLYMVEFASGRLDAAEAMANQCIAVAEEYKQKFSTTQDYREIECSTCYRHLAKIMLLKRVSADDILKVFWFCYDGHKALVQRRDSQNRVRLLKDDLSLLFMIKVYQHSRHKDPCKSAFLAVEKQANQELPVGSVKVFVKNIKRNSQDLRQGKALPLSHSFFPELKEAQPHFKMPTKKGKDTPVRSELPTPDNSSSTSPSRGT